MDQQAPTREISRQEAVARLWMMGILKWKLDPVQKELYATFENSKHKTTVWSASRRLGKSYALCCIAAEKCLQKPNTIVKFIAPTQKHVKMIIRPLLKEVFKDCPSELRPEFRTADNIYRFQNGSEIQLAGTDSGHAENLRGGCLSADTLIMTPFGPTPISELCVGDEVYGVNRDGSVSITQVKNTFYHGKKEVVELIKNNQVIGECTFDHKWLIRSRSNCFILNRPYNDHELAVKDISQENSRFVRKFVKDDSGLKEPHAYVLGALIGDGECPQVGYNLYIASLNEEVPNKIASIINGYVFKSDKYKYCIKNNNIRYKHSIGLQINYYDEWLRGKTFLNKNFDWDIVNLWDRESCLNLLAGLIDTDGSVYHHKSDNNLEIQYHSSNLDLLNNINKLLLKLFQYRGIIKEDKRKDKYNYPHYKLRIRSSLFSKIILKELSPYLAKTHKQYKSEYDSIPHSEHEEFVKVNFGKTSIKDTYDIEVDNETHLYLTADGLVTHNSADLCIVDEAGFCDDLRYIIQSILIPTTTTTRGKIILSSTPPKLSTHEFVKYMEEAEARGNFVKKTIYDGLRARITQEIIDEIVEELGGIHSPEFRREYLCEIVRDEESTVVPEFTEELQKEIVKEWPRPPYYDIYIAGDIGFKDFTVFLFAYYDFKAARVIIEDEVVMNGMTTDDIAKKLKEKETSLYTDPTTGEQKQPYLRVCDNNLIVINDLHKLHGLTFLATAKDDASMALNNMRILLKQGRIIIHPRCKTLINHLKYANWNKSQTSFARSSDNGHYDAVDAIKYLCRAIQQSKNPYPSTFGMGTGEGWWHSQVPSNKPSTTTIEGIKDLFKVKRSITLGRK